MSWSTGEVTERITEREWVVASERKRKGRKREKRETER